MCDSGICVFNTSKCLRRGVFFSLKEKFLKYSFEAAEIVLFSVLFYYYDEVVSITLSKIRR
jgi:hypothetical protein